MSANVSSSLEAPGESPLPATLRLLSGFSSLWLSDWCPHFFAGCQREHASASESPVPLNAWALWSTNQQTKPHLGVNLWLLWPQVEITPICVGAPVTWLGPSSYFKVKQLRTSPTSAKPFIDAPILVFDLVTGNRNPAGGETCLESSPPYGPWSVVPCHTQTACAQADSTQIFLRGIHKYINQWTIKEMLVEVSYLTKPITNKHQPPGKDNLVPLNWFGVIIFHLISVIVLIHHVSSCHSLVGICLADDKKFQSLFPL